MKIKVISLGLIIMMIMGVILLTGCNKKKDNAVDSNKVNIENKLATISADAIFYRRLLGGECSEYFEFHICYDALKVYEYEIFNYYPMVEPNEKTEPSSPPSFF